MKLNTSKSNAACFYTPILLKLLTIIQMCKNQKEGNFIKINLTPQSCKVPISIVAVNCFEDIDHIDWLHKELNIYGGGMEPLTSSCADLSYLIQFFYLLIWFTKVRKWSGGYCYT